ncbi:MAG: hypothetical protein Q7S80_00570, partial [bacterium]|nr:hypothetical protein [bacterium]
MAKISISDVLKKRRHFRVVTVFACLLLLLALGQIVLIRGSQKTVAAADWFRDPVARTCILIATRNPGEQYNIPANCEGFDITIDGAITVYADDVVIWQGSDKNHYECPPTLPSDSSYKYNSIVGSTCKYLKYVSKEDTKTMESPYTYCPYQWWFWDGTQYSLYSLTDQTVIMVGHRKKYQCEYSKTVSSPDWKTFPANSVQNVKGQDCTAPKYSGYQID